MSDQQLDRHEDHIVVPLRRKVAYGMSGVAESLVNGCVQNWNLLYYNTLLGVDAVKVGLAMSIPRFYDAITDPLMGQLSDNFRSRWGRRRPFMLLGGPFWCLFFLLTWLAPQDLSEDGKFYYLLAMALFFYSFQTLTIVPANALGAELSVDYNERTRVFAVKTLVSVIGLVMVPAVWQVAHWQWLFPNPVIGFKTIALILAILSLGCIFWSVAGTREEAELQEREKIRILPGMAHAFRNGPFVLLIIICFLLIIGVFGALPFANYINIYYVYGGDQEAAGPVMTANGVVSNLLFLAWIPLFSWIGVKVGKRNALFLCFAIVSVAPLSSWFLITPKYPYLQILFHSLVALGIAGIQVFPNAMVADLVDIDEIRTDRRREGVYMAVFYFILKVGLSGSTLSLSLCLNWAGFDEDLAVQPPGTIRNLRILLAILPLITIGVSTLLLLLYPLNEKTVRENREILEQRRRQRIQALAESE